MASSSGSKLGWLIIGGVLLFVVVVTAVVVGRGHSSGGLVGGPVAGTAGGTSGGQGPGAAPVEVVKFQGQYCAAEGPQGWAVTSEVPERASFGADFRSADGNAGAGFSIFPSGGLSPIPGVSDPDQSVSATLSNMGTVPVTFGQKIQLEDNVYEVYFHLPQSEGIAFYQVIPVPGGSMVTLRTATTLTGLWSARGAEASAVARSLHCNVPYVPPAPDPPSLNAKSGSGEGNSEYNVWLEREYYHNPQTGENYWVSPTEDWDENGPEGPGYYTKNGNDVIKLQPGYSQ